MKVKLVKRDDELKEIFNEEELKKLFKELKVESDHKYWIPLIGLYSGARLEEISQLHVTDIKQIDKIWTIDINFEGEKKLKTKSSKRLIPVHKNLIGMGFIEYWQGVKASGYDRLFPNLKRIKGKYGHSMSKWFSNYLIRIGIKTVERKLSFHSLRHTFITKAKRLELPEGHIKEIVGHANKSITYGLYGKSYEIQKLKTIIDKIDFALGHKVK
jgi:integrase